MHALNLGIPREITAAPVVSRKILQQVDKVVFSRVAYILHPDCDLIIVVKIRLLNLNGLPGCIVNRASRNIRIFCLGCSGNRNSVRQFARLHIDQLRIKYVLRAAFAAVLIEVLYSNLVNRDLMEDRHRGNVAINRGFRGDFLTRISVDPFLEDLALDKGSLRQGTDRRAFLRKILRKSDVLLPAGILCTNHEGDLVHIVEIRRDGQVLTDDVLGLCFGSVLVEPLHKLLTLGGGIGRKHQRISVIEGVREIDLGLIQHKGDREDVLLIGGPDSGIFADDDRVVKNAAAVGPAGDVSVLFRRSRHIINRVVGA